MDEARLSYDRSEILDVLRDLNMIVVSLDRIGSRFSTLDPDEYNKISSDFLTNWDVTRKLARARRILSRPFSDESDAGGLHELERAFKDLQF